MPSTTKNLFKRRFMPGLSAGKELAHRLTAILIWASAVSLSNLTCLMSVSFLSQLLTSEISSLCFTLFSICWRGVVFFFTFAWIYTYQTHSRLCMGSKVSASMYVEWNITSLKAQFLFLHCRMSFLKIMRFVNVIIFLKNIFLDKLSDFSNYGSRKILQIEKGAVFSLNTLFYHVFL